MAKRKSKSPERQAGESLKALQEVSLELIRSRNLSSLLRTICEKSLRLMCCDGASIYLEGEKGFLRFEVALNQSIHFNFKRRELPIEDRSVAATVFRKGEPMRFSDVYKLSAKSEVVFPREYDYQAHYRSKSILAVPLKNSKGKVLGVIQVINKKENTRQKWQVLDEQFIAQMPAFSAQDQSLLESFAAVAATAIESARLYSHIENLFDSFVRASVMAIDSRDPGTRGHSERVATLTVALAKALSDSEDERVAHVKFSELQLKELLYAGLLHDFGKIGVRESTLQKEQKLSELQRIQLRTRMDQHIYFVERKAFRDLLVMCIHENRSPTEIEMKRVEKSLEENRKDLDEKWQLIQQLSLPTVLDKENEEKILQLSKFEILEVDGFKTLLSHAEVQALRIRRGCLTEDERAEIESHVTQSYQFLNQIPWGEDYSRIPDIAFGHHEFLDGTGYPRKLKAPEIPIASQIMTVCDIFDALSASDRAYKKALPVSVTLGILDQMAAQGKINKDYLQIFKDQQIWKLHNYEALSASTKIAA